jgi:hypothetical protein
MFFSLRYGFVILALRTNTCIIGPPASPLLDFTPKPGGRDCLGLGGAIAALPHHHGIGHPLAAFGALQLQILQRHVVAASVDDRLQSAGT